MGWCRRADLRSEDAADVLQEVFQAVARAIGNFRHDQPGSTFRGWLSTITRNKIRDHFRRRKGQPAGIGGSDAQRALMQVAADASESSVGQNSVTELFQHALDLIRAEFEDRTWQTF